MREPESVADGAGGYNINWHDRGYYWGQLGRPSGVGGDYTPGKMQYATRHLFLNDAEKSDLDVGWELIAQEKSFEIISILDSHAGITDLIVRSETANAT